MSTPLLCRFNFHRWGKPRKRREGGFLRFRRRCQRCLLTQEQIPTGDWKTVVSLRRRKLRLQSPTAEQKADRERGMEA